MKKLTINDIPEEYFWAAVDGDGCANAFKVKPTIKENAFWGAGSHINCRFIGSEYDASNWMKSLISKQPLKRLTIDDIPDGFCYAAVNCFGEARAYKTKPVLEFDESFWRYDPNSVLIGRDFDASNCKNSLIGGDPYVIQIMKNQNKRKMERLTLESCKFEFTQDANCLSDCSKIEKIKIIHQSDLGLDRTKGGFFVLKTKGWSINSEDDIKKLLDKIRLAMKKE